MIRGPYKQLYYTLDELEYYKKALELADIKNSSEYKQIIKYLNELKECED